LQAIRAVGSVCIFLALALLMLPVSTCLLPPCGVPEVIRHGIVALLVSFAVSVFVAVQHRFANSLVYVVDWFVHPEDREAGAWSVLTSGVKLPKESLPA
jgi:hypothetical protein